MLFFKLHLYNKNVNIMYNLSGVSNLESNISSTVIGAGTSATLLSQDHTTQILAVVVQIITLVLMFLKKKEPKNQ